MKVNIRQKNREIVVELSIMINGIDFALRDRIRRSDFKVPVVLNYPVEAIVSLLLRVILNNKEVKSCLKKFWMIKGSQKLANEEVIT